MGDVLRANLTFLRLCVFNQFRSIYVTASAHAAKTLLRLAALQDAPALSVSLQASRTSLPV